MNIDSNVVCKWDIQYMSSPDQNILFQFTCHIQQVGGFTYAVTPSSFLKKFTLANIHINYLRVLMSRLV